MIPIKLTLACLTTSPILTMSNYHFTAGASSFGADSHQPGMQSHDYYTFVYGHKEMRRVKAFVDDCQPFPSWLRGSPILRYWPSVITLGVPTNPCHQLLNRGGICPFMALVTPLTIFGWPILAIPMQSKQSKAWRPMRSSTGRLLLLLSCLVRWRRCP